MPSISKSRVADLASPLTRIGFLPVQVHPSREHSLQPLGTRMSTAKPAHLSRSARRRLSARSVREQCPRTPVVPSV